MKKKLLTGILMLMFVVFGGASVVAGEIRHYDNGVSVAPAGGEENISQQTLKEFKKMFSFAANENWYKVSDGFIVKFTHEGIQYRAGYDVKGRWINTIKSYDETKLPADIRYRVKSAYLDFAIVFVEEITLPYDMGYVIHIESDHAIKKLVITDIDSDIQVLEAYRKK